MQNSFSLGLLLVLAVLPCSLNAAIQPTPLVSVTPTPSSTPSQKPAPLLSINNLDEHLARSYASKRARTLKQASTALWAKQFAKAVSLATPIQEDELFSDYAYWIIASAERGLAKKSLDSKNFEGASQQAKKSIQALLQVGAKSPYSPFLKTLPREIADAEILMGESYWARQKWTLAQQNYERGFQRLQNANQLLTIQSSTLDHYGMSCKKHSSLLCTSWLQRFATAFSKRTEEMKVISQYAPPGNDRLKFVKPLSKITLTYKAPDLDQVAFDAGMKTYFEGKYKDAIKALRQFLDDFPRSTYRYRARYWLAQSLTHEQEHEKAKKMYEELQQETPLTYYGLLAATAIGKPIDSQIDTSTPVAAENDDGLTPLETFRLKRAKHLLAEKAYGLASYEFKDLKARDGLSSPFLAYLAMLNFKSRNYSGCFQLIGELIQRGYDGILSGYGLQMIFPMDFFDLIKKYSNENGLDPILVLSLIKQESAFDEEVNSGVGAMGLMQLMPTTASETDPQVSIANLLEAEPNIRVGTKYLKKLMTRFNGNIVLALAGYNAGPNAADRWIRDNPQGRGIQEFIESIPYKETREYVGSIIRNYYWYSRQLNGQLPKSLGFFWSNPSSPDPAAVKMPNATAIPQKKVRVSRKK